MKHRRKICLVMAGLIAAPWLALLAGCQSFPKAGSGNFFSKKAQKNRLVPESNELLDPLGARNPNRISLHDLTPSQIGTTMKMAGSKVDEVGAKEAFDDGKAIYNEAIAARDANPNDKSHIELLEEAANKFRLAGKLFPDSALHQDALFYQGESYYFSNRYVQANRAYESLIVQYSGSRYFDRAEERRFSIARYWLGRAREENMTSAVKFGDPSRPTMGMAGEARRVLHRIRLDDPTGKLADDATMQLAAAFMEAGLYQDAADTFEDLRRSYPGSTHFFNAHLFELKCRMNCYYGRSYEVEPLNKADTLLKQIVQTFPNESREHEEYLGREAVRIRNMLAERDFSMGQYYEKRGENRAAKLVYNRVERRFGDTAYAEELPERIANVDDGPPLPPQKAQWLVDLFPKTETARPLIAAKDSEEVRR